jgi:hypothetical protein
MRIEASWPGDVIKNVKVLTLVYRIVGIESPLYHQMVMFPVILDNPRPAFPILLFQILTPHLLDLYHAPLRISYWVHLPDMPIAINDLALFH